MKLSALSSGLTLKAESDIEDVEITSLAYDSREVSSDSLYFCVKGFKVDGHDFAMQAQDSGAAAIVCERQSDVSIPQLMVEDSRAAMAAIATKFYGNPSNVLQLVGVTGTNGKTTTTYLLRSILEHSGVHTGLLGTVQQVVAGKVGPAIRTTQEAIDLQGTFKEMTDGGDGACVMEVSSHALELHRCDYVDFDVALFTNLTQDHLDFHGTMEQYYQSKRKLFFPESADAPKISVIYADDPYGKRLIDELRAEDRQLIRFSAQDSDCEYFIEQVFGDGSSFKLSVSGTDSVDVATGLPGQFNAINAAAAVAVSGVLGVSTDEAIEALKTAKPAPGRFESIDRGQSFRVVVDYAHTPDSLENLLEAADKISDGKVIVVFGCGGDRDVQKRPLMGEIACDLADRVIVTSDNPRSEDPELIIDQIIEGCEKIAEFPVGHLERISDRRKAIEFTISQAGAGDIVVIAGKGHEQGQEFEDGRKVAFDDRKVALEVLAGLDQSNG